MRNLILVTVLVVAAAAWAVWQRDAEHAVDASAAGPFVPGLELALNDVASVRVSSGGESFHVTRADDGWVLSEWGDYPAAFETVKSTLTGVADMQTRQVMTSLAKRHADLGLEHPGEPEATSVGLRLEDAAGAVLADLIVGRARVGNPPGVYVRRAGEDQTWLVTGNVTPPKDAAGWADKQLLRVPAERVQSVELSHPDGEVVRVARPAPPAEIEADGEGDAETDPADVGDPDALASAADAALADLGAAPVETPEWELVDLPEGHTPKSAYVLSNVAGALARLDMERMALDDDALPADEAWTRARVSTADGLLLDLQLGSDADELQWYARIEASAAETAEAGVRAEAGSLAARMAGHTFVLPRWQATTLTKRLADLADPPPPEPEPVPDEGLLPLAPEHLPEAEAGASDPGPLPVVETDEALPLEGELPVDAGTDASRDAGADDGTDDGTDDGDSAR